MVARKLDGQSLVALPIVLALAWKPSIFPETAALTADDTPRSLLS